MPSDIETEKLEEAQRKLALKQNPSDIVPDVTKLAFNQRRSLRQTPVVVTLPPYTSDPKYTEPDNAVISGEPISTSTTTEFEGRKAKVISFVISQPVILQPNSEYAYPINRFEDGEITHFTVALNDPDLRVVLTLYDDDQRPDPICSESANDLVLLGRGLTHGQAIAVDVDGISLDPKGERHSVMPYVLRHKHTFSYGFNTNSTEDYDKVAGTPNDRWFIIEYEPTLPAPYKKIFFTIQNPTHDPKIIHSARLRRYEFVDKYTQQNPLLNANANQFPLNQNPSQVSTQSYPFATLAQMARKAKISG